MNLSELFTIYVEFVFLDALCSTSACRDLVKTYFHDDCMFVDIGHFKHL